MENNSQILATKEDLQREVSRLEIKISDTKVDLVKEIAYVKVSLGKEISDTRSDLIKWMFIFWIGQAGISIGLILHFLKR